ncbi:hypothetical protein D3C81_943710 [compost metagenome]
MVEVVLLIPVSLVVAGTEQRIKLIFLPFNRMLPTNAVIIAIEHNRIPILAKQNKGVGAWLEPILHPRFQRLIRLGIMVIHESYGIQRV